MYDLPTCTQQTRDKTETRGLQSGAGCYLRMVGELFKSTGEISGLPPQSLFPLVWVILKDSRVADLRDPVARPDPHLTDERLRAR